MNNEFQDYALKNKELMFEILKELCHIPAPSHHEEQRAAYCKERLEAFGAKGVYIDEALNVVFPLGCDGSDEIVVFEAHTDTVFPDTEPMPYVDDGINIHCPGVSDDTAGVVVIMTMAKYFLENGIVPPKGILLVCNSCEEGLGNLKGTRQIFKDYEGRIKKFITLDGGLNRVADRCVGSHRYKVEVTTAGGHSYAAFGNKNALACLAEIISDIYKITVPHKPDTKTTYNVGIVEGGTSVNTIAQSASMLCEYRSDDSECLEFMENKFTEIFEKARKEDVDVKVTLVGERPCGIVPAEIIEEFKAEIVPAIEEIIGEQVMYASSSTDCNIPLSLGVPALCLGSNYFKGIHTREEYMEKESIVKGIELALKVASIIAF